MAIVLGRRLRAFLLPERGVVRPAPYAVVVSAALAAGMAIALSAPVQRIEWTVYDAAMRRATATPDPAPDVVVVAIDELSFAEVALPWPWPRALHAQLIESIAAQAPARIVFDVVFEGRGASAEGDAALAAAIRAAGNVVLGVDRAPIADRNYSVVQWSEPDAQLAAPAAALAVVTIPLDPDLAIRRAAFAVEGRPTLAVAALAGADLARLPDRDQLPLIRFNGPPRQGIATVSYYQALDAVHLLPPGFFTGKYVFIGRSLRAPAGNDADYFRTAAGQMAGVEIHATIADALRRGRFVADPLAEPPRLVLACVALAAVAAVLAFVVSPGIGALALTALVALFVTAAYTAFASSNIRLPVVAPTVLVGVAYAAGAAYRFALANRERRLIKRAFKNFVAPAIVDQMLADPSRLKLGGEEYEVTILFSDLEGFTTLSEHLTPQQLTAHLTGYFRDMIDRLLGEQATLDKLIGDSIMVYFGCPIPDADHPLRACRAALALQQRMTELNAEWAQRGLPQLRTRVGINTGTVVAGNMGTDTIFNFTVIGDPVNLASRLEGANKAYGTLVMVGEDTWSRVSSHVEGRELDWIRVKGKARPIAIYELAGLAGTLSATRRELFARFAAGLAAYRQAQWQDAAAHFAAALALDPGDGPSLTFAARCAQYLAAGTPPQWDGVHVMQTK